MDFSRFIYPHGTKKSLSDFESDYSNNYKSKDEGVAELQKCKERLAELQDILYSHNKYSILIILQGMDASGKDGIIKHVMSGINLLRRSTYCSYSSTYSQKAKPT